MFTLAELDEVVPLVRANVPPTPQYAWPLLKARTGVEVVVKHENHSNRRLQGPRWRRLF
jgi:threonine dehydratase